MTGEHARPDEDNVLEKIRDHLLSNRTYDRLKKVVVLYFPAGQSFYMGLASLWDLPDPTRVIQTTILINTFLGAVILISTKSYNKSQAKFDGSLDVAETDSSQIFGLGLTTLPEDLANKDQVLLKVNKQ